MAPYRGKHRRTDDERGQVSKVASFGGPGTDISPEDSVAGAPPAESGPVDEGATGPEAPTDDPLRGHQRDKADVETTG
ncbi:MAG: hypothetical protein JWN91_2498 [Nocardioides sp.]|jgi:hypothetical protein|nr:hypothetical protein [Nocardioides sp.]